MLAMRVGPAAIASHQGIPRGTKGDLLVLTDYDGDGKTALPRCFASRSFVLGWLIAKVSLCMFVFLVMTTAAFAGQFIPVSGNKMPGEYIVVLRSDFQGQAINNSAVALASV